MGTDEMEIDNRWKYGTKANKEELIKYVSEINNKQHIVLLRSKNYVLTTKAFHIQPANNDPKKESLIFMISDMTMAIVENDEFCRPRLPEEAVPRAGPKPDDAGKPSLQVTKFHGAHERGKVSTKRAQGGAIFRARIERCDQEDRGASERRGYCLCEGQAICLLLRGCSSDRASSGVDSASVRLPRNCRRISPSARQTDSASRTRVYQRSRPRCDQDFSVVRRRTQCRRDRKRASFRS